MHGVGCTRRVPAALQRVESPPTVRWWTLSRRAGRKARSAVIRFRAQPRGRLAAKPSITPMKKRPIFRDYEVMNFPIFPKFATKCRFIFSAKEQLSTLFARARSTSTLCTLRSVHIFRCACVSWSCVYTHGHLYACAHAIIFTYQCMCVYHMCICVCEDLYMRPYMPDLPKNAPVRPILLNLHAVKLNIRVYTCLRVL